MIACAEVEGGQGFGPGTTLLLLRPDAPPPPATAAGANLIGMILWPRAKRSISSSTAREVAAAARRHGAEPVAVFVDEAADTIARVCREADVRVAQLHGDGARAALPHLPPDLAVIYVMHADKAGHLQTPPPPQQQQTAAASSRWDRSIWSVGCCCCAVRDSGAAAAAVWCGTHSNSLSVCLPPCLPAYRQPHWLIVDGLQGGSGESFDWHQLRHQASGFGQHSSHGWLLAGGLTPDTVAGAEIARHGGVYVSVPCISCCLPPSLHGRTPHPRCSCHRHGCPHGCRREQRRLQPRRPLQGPRQGAAVLQRRLGGAQGCRTTRADDVAVPHRRPPCKSHGYNSITGAACTRSTHTRSTLVTPT